MHFFGSPMEPVIRVEFKFKEEDGLPSHVLTSVIAHIEEVLYEIQLDVLEDLKKIPDLPRVSFEAAQQRIQSYQGMAFLIKRAESGSIILEGLLVSLAIWILNKTAGETLKEAYKESQLHKVLKAKLLTPISKETLKPLCKRLKAIRPSLAYHRNIWPKYPRNYHLPALELEIEIIEEGMKIIIKITVHSLSPDEIPPTGMKVLEINPDCPIQKN